MPARLQMGDMVQGVVQSVTPYGIFVDIGAGQTGMLHLSQITGNHITADDMVKMFAQGDNIKVSGLQGQRKRNKSWLRAIE
jgi:small subunit ribosomal protein S1